MPVGHRGEVTDLVKDIRLLAKLFQSIEAESDLSKFLEGFLPEIAARWLTDSGDEGRVKVTFLGARGVGKSTLFNWMAGSPLARTGWLPQSGPDPVVDFLVEPGAVDAGNEGWIPIAPEIGDTVHKVALGGFAFKLIIQDSPRDLVGLGAALGRSDDVVLVASAERYADRLPLDCAWWSSLAGCGIVPVLNMVRDPLAVAMGEYWERMLVSRLADQSVVPLSLPWIPGDSSQTKGSGIAKIIWQSVCRMVQENAGVKKRQKQYRCLVEFIELIDRSGLRQHRDILASAALAIQAEGKIAGRDLIKVTQARLRSKGLSAAGAKILELLELPGHGRILSLSFRFAGWPLRQWLLGGKSEAAPENSESTVRRVLGNWIAKVSLSVARLWKKESQSVDKVPAFAPFVLGKASKIDLAPLIAKAKELDAFLDSQANATMCEWLMARPGVLGLLRAVIAFAQGFSVAAAIWYGSAGILSLVYLGVFAGLADMVLVLSVRIPLFFIERQTLREWEKRVGTEIIDPCARLMEEHFAVGAGPWADAIAAIDRARRALATSRTGVEAGL